MTNPSPYRAIPIDGKDFVYGWYLKAFGKHYIYGGGSDDWEGEWDGKGTTHELLTKLLGFIEVQPSTVGQQVGLKDKNGEEIYTGDIICEWFGGKMLEWSTWEVRIENCTCGYQCCIPENHHLDDYGFKPFYDEGEWADMERYEITGNIHQEEKP